MNVGFGELWRYFMSKPKQQEDSFKKKIKKKKKTKAMWIGSSKNNKTKPLEINIPADPIKTLGTYLSHDRDKNNNLNFFSKNSKDGNQIKYLIVS